MNAIADRCPPTAGARTKFWVLVSLLAIHAALLAWGAVVHSPTIDEVGWLASGVAHWESGRLDIVINHPPHVGLVAALPVLAAGAESEVYQNRAASRSVGHEFMRRNGSRSFWLFTLGRWACIPFSLVGAIGCYCWARDLYGPTPGLLACALWCFCPNILAHGQLVSHDVPAASLGLIATYAFWRWLNLCNWKRTLAAGIALGLALLAKMTMLVHMFVWPIAWIAWRITDRERRGSLRGWIVEGLVLILILSIALDVVNLAYGFQDSLAPLKTCSFRSRFLAGVHYPRGNRFSESAVGLLPIPLPRSYVEGIDFQRYALEGHLPFQYSYLRGQWSTQGWWYYYLYALVVKVPLGTWCLLILSLVARLVRADDLCRARDEMVLLLPAGALLLAASTSPTWTDHVRYVLGVLPAAFIWISRIGVANPWTHPAFRMLATVALGWTFVSCLWHYPHSLSYFNELAGGPRGGAYHLLSSNIDYGQDLVKLKRWCDTHPEAQPIGLAYWDMDSVDPRLAGIDFAPAPSGPAPGKTVTPADAGTLGPRPGWYAVNVNLLHGDDWPGRRNFPEIGYYGYFLELDPVARAGYSINIYHVSLADANRVRRKMGLPPVEEEPR